MQKAAPTVTAILPSYNAEEFIRPTLDSLAAQTWPNLEILIGDDCSTDGTAEILGGFVAKQPNARLIIRDKNLGWVDNMNDLMARAKGEYMFFAFHDDIVAPTYVERLVAALVERPSAILAYSDLELTEVDGSTYRLACTSMENVTGEVNRGLTFLADGETWWVPNRGLFRSEAFQRIGGIKIDLFGDTLWLFHMALLGDFVRVPEVLCWKFFKKSGLTKTRTYDSNSSEKQKAFINEIWRSELPVSKKIFFIMVLRGYGQYLPHGARSAFKRAIDKLRT